MIGSQEYAYGIGDETVHNGHIYTTIADHESGEFAETVVFENKLGNEGNNKRKRFGAYILREA